MRRLITLLPLLLLVTLLAIGCGTDQSLRPADDTKSGEPLTLDPEVRTGTLENGLTYYVRANQEPENRAELWLVVNSGSTNEDDDQRGLAHFLEHMLFNGTAEYPATELVNFLESIGMQFGPDVNAYTSFDETVYTLQAPTDTPETLAKGLDVLNQWASAALIDPEQVEKERGVVTEEWRMRDLNAQGRVSDEVVRALLGGSRYAERLPIGDMGIVASAPAETIRHFYETWYRPDNMAIIAVGDFDPARMESDIRAQFGDLSNPESALTRSEWQVPDYSETQAHVITDPEFPATYVQISFKQEPAPAVTVEDFRSSLVTGAALQILNYRLDDLRREPNPPFLFAGADVGSFVRAADQSSVYAQVEDGTAVEGLTSISGEVERLRQHGVTAAEVERSRTDTLRGFQQRAAESQNTPNADFAGSLRDAFLTGAVPVSAEEAYRLAQALLPTISADEVKARTLELFPHGNRLVMLIAPDKTSVALPSETDLLAQMREVEARDYEPPTESVAVGALLDVAPEPSAIVSETTVPEIGATVIELANGITIWLKPTDFKDDQVLFLLSSPGGTSMVEDGDVVATNFATAVAGDSGVGALTQTVLQRALTGKNLSLAPFIDDISEGLSGSASPQDLETMLQLAYLYATQPRIDPDALALFQRQVASYLDDRALVPESALEERLSEIVCGGTDPRCDSLAALEQVDLLETGQLLEAYQSRFANLGDATALMVGSFDLEAVKPLIQRYLGALPAAGDSEIAQDRIAALPHQVFAETVDKGIDPRSYVVMSWQVPLTPSVESRVALRALEGVLDIRLREVIREEMAAIYGAGVRGSVKSAPENEYSMMIEFTAAPTRSVEVVAAVQSIIAEMRDNGPSNDVLSRAKQTLLSNHEENLTLNEAWLEWLRRYVIAGEGPVTDMLAILEAIDTLTPADVQTMAQRVLPPDTRIELILYPEGFTP